MPNRLEITTKYDNGYWLVRSAVAEDSDADFPREIFLWTIGESGALNKFQAIGHIDQVAKHQSYSPSRTSNFGIHLVKYNISEQRMSTVEDAEKVVIVLKSAFNILVEGFEASKEPVIEYYP